MKEEREVIDKYVLRKGELKFKSILKSLQKELKENDSLW